MEDSMQSIKCVPPSTWLLTVACVFTAIAACIAVLAKWAARHTPDLPPYLSWLNIPVSPDTQHKPIKRGLIRRHSSFEEAAASVNLKDMIRSDLSPAENAANLMDFLLQGEHLTSHERDICYYVNGVLKLNKDSAVVPKQLLSGAMSGINGEDNVAEWLRQEYTPLGHKKKKTTLKAHVQGVIFALRLRNSAFHDSTVPKADVLPFETTPDRLEIIESLLLKVDDWDFDIFALNEASDGRPLEVLGWHLLHRWKLVERFNIDKNALKAWLSFVKSGYRADNAYHTALHAADVLHATHFMLGTAQLSTYLSEIEVLAVMLAAMIHDIGHDGMSNTFHKNSLTDRALEYNDQSIQENFHVSHVFSQMMKDDLINIFKTFSHKQYVELRLMMIEMVLGTDMSKHFAELNEFKNLIATRGTTESAWSNETTKLMGVVLHTCDISGQAKPYSTALKWGERCMKEFFHQGDTEKELGLPISPMCDRKTTNIDSSQIGFIKFIVLPAFQAVAEILPVVSQTCVPHLEKNLEHYQFQLQLQTAAEEKAVAKADAKP